MGPFLVPSLVIFWAWSQDLGILLAHMLLFHPTLDLMCLCLPHLWSHAGGRTPLYTRAVEPLLGLATAPLSALPGKPCPELGSSTHPWPCASLPASSVHFPSSGTQLGSVKV